MTENAIEKHNFFSTGQDNQWYANELVKHARRSLEFFTQYLDPRIYGQPEFIENLRQFCIANSHNQVRILIQDSSTIVKNGHRMISLIQRFTSTIEIRKTPEEYADIHYSYLIADDNIMLHKDQEQDFAGEFFYQDPVPVLRQLEKFNLIWEHSEADPELRRLYL
jgi:hypothetical protein